MKPLITFWPLDFNEREDFEEKAASSWVTKEKPPSFRMNTLFGK